MCHVWVESVTAARPTFGSQNRTLYGETEHKSPVFEGVVFTSVALQLDVPEIRYVLLPHGGAFRVVADAVFWYNNIITVRTKENLRALAVQTTAGRYFKFRM